MTLVPTWFDGPAECTRPRLVLIATSLGVLFAQIDTSVINLALKSIGANLHAGVSEMQWVIDSYNLAYASLLLTAGTLGDLYGRRRIFVLGIVLFIVGTLLCALAPNAATLIGGRIVSGIGAAFEVPMSLVLLTLAYPDRNQRAHALGIWASCNALAFIIGPMVGGWLVDTVGCEAYFTSFCPFARRPWHSPMSPFARARSRADVRSTCPGKPWPSLVFLHLLSPQSKGRTGGGARP